MKKNLHKSYIDFIPQKYKCKTCIGCVNLSDTECGKLKCIRYSSAAKYYIKIPDDNCSIHNKTVSKVVNV